MPKITVINPKLAFNLFYMAERVRQLIHETPLYEVDALPPTSEYENRIVVYGGSVWFSDGESWVELSGGGGGGGGGASGVFDGGNATPHTDDMPRIDFGRAV